MLLVIDNYDSFTYNLVQYLGELGESPRVVRNDTVALDDITALGPSAIVISPGPRTPREAGICIPLIRRFGMEIPILGVCLGHQAIGEAYGGRIIRAPCGVMHGKTSKIQHDSTGLFDGISSPLEVMRYHSLVVREESMPGVLEATAHTRDGVVMGLRHRELPIFGVQFHPESIASEHGHEILANFLAIARGRNDASSRAA